MGHRDLLVTHNLSDGEHHCCRPHSRGSVRRASGFVLTGNPELIGRQPKNWTVRSLTLSYLMCRSTSPLVRGSRRQRSCLSSHLREEDSHFRSWLRADITVRGSISAPHNICLIEQSASGRQ